MHYTRLRIRGDIGSAERERAEHGSGSINGYGYRVIKNPEHPLAVAQGKLLEHRAILFDAIGDGEHPCHWCGAILSWRGAASARINVDHIDHDKLNNELANLVASCLYCNTKRRAVPRTPATPKPRIYTEEQRERARERARAHYKANREQKLEYARIYHANKRAERSAQ